jgi:hypothetical protein
VNLASIRHTKAEALTSFSAKYKDQIEKCVAFFFV